MFTDTAYAGNPLAVVLDADGLTDASCSSVAREFNLSETAFPCAPPAARLRPAHLHPRRSSCRSPGTRRSGAAWVLPRRRPHRGRRQRAGLRRGSARPCIVDADGVDASPAVRRTVGPPLDPRPLLAAVGLTATTSTALRRGVAGTGIDFGFLLVGPSALARVRPDLRRWSPPLGGTGVVALERLATASSGARAGSSRGGVGIAEDPATGSAALPSGVYLTAAGLIGDGVHVVRRHPGRRDGPAVHAALRGHRRRGRRGVSDRHRVGGARLPGASSVLAADIMDRIWPTLDRQGLTRPPTRDAAASRALRGVDQRTAHRGGRAVPALAIAFWRNALAGGRAAAGDALLRRRAELRRLDARERQAGAARRA